MTSNRFFRATAAFLSSCALVGTMFFPTQAHALTCNTAPDLTTANYSPAGPFGSSYTMALKYTATQNNVQVTKFGVFRRGTGVSGDSTGRNIYLWDSAGTLQFAYTLPAWTSASKGFQYVDISSFNYVLNNGDSIKVGYGQETGGSSLVWSISNNNTAYGPVNLNNAWYHPLINGGNPTTSGAFWYDNVIEVCV